MLVLDIEYHHYTWAHVCAHIDRARSRVAVQTRAQLGLGLLGLGYARRGYVAACATRLVILDALLVLGYRLIRQQCMRRLTKLKRSTGLKRLPTR